MKRVIAIVFLCSFLTANSAFGQALRLPVLIHHYLEHAEQDNLTFFEYFSQHYLYKINHPDDKHQDHERLPFKSVDGHKLHHVTLAPAAIFALSQIIFQANDVKIAQYNQASYSNSYLNRIWQPPRFS